MAAQSEDEFPFDFSEPDDDVVRPRSQHPDTDRTERQGSAASGKQHEHHEPDAFSLSDLEEAYLRALESTEGAEWIVDEDAPLDDGSFEDEVDPFPAPPDGPLSVTEAPVASGPELERQDGESSSHHADGFDGDAVAGESESGDPIEAVHVEGNDSAEAGLWAAQAPVESGAGPSLPVGDLPSDDRAPARPKRVVEACLFVGGAPLSARRLAGLLDGNNEPAVIEGLIDQLNHEYAVQGRPYEIRLGDGGYRVALRAEYESIRNRVYGVGPRDVKLSQDALEVLALVAYQQPISQADVEVCKPHSANLLRQLLRRELISLTRIDQTRQGVEYQTTARFLQLFGLGQLSELPRPEDLSFR